MTCIDHLNVPKIFNVISVALLFYSGAWRSSLIRHRTQEPHFRSPLTLLEPEIVQERFPGMY